MVQEAKKEEVERIEKLAREYRTNQAAKIESKPDSLSGFLGYLNVKLQYGQ